MAIECIFWRIVGLAIAGVAAALCVAIYFGAGKVSILLAAVIPFGLLLAAVGLSPWEIAARWDYLKGWQRGVLTLAAIVGSIGVAVGVGAAIVAANE